MRTVTIIPILNAAVVNSEATVEAAYSVTPCEVMNAIEALKDGSIHVRVLGATMTGSPDFTITGIEGSIDGTLYYTWITFGTAVTVNAATELGLRPIADTNPLDHRTTKLRCVMGGSAPDGSNYLTLTVQVVAYIPSC
jgi:hypothetical protein